MKIPSISHLANTAKTTFLRFPLSLLSAFIAVVLAIYMVEIDFNVKENLNLLNIMLTAALGIPLFFCAAIFSEKTKYNTWLCYGVAALLLVLMYFSLPSSDIANSTSVPYIRYAIFNITAHLLVSIAPFLKSKELNAFWNYNKILFIRLWASVLYSGFLYVGIALALTALRLLFDIKFEDELFFEIFIVTIGAFNTWFFMAGIPQNLETLEADTHYPKGLKVFTQFVLLPLLLLYLVILYGYMAKIITAWDWPKGIVSYMISIVSVLGILTFLLLYPYGQQKENSWIKKFTSAYYMVLIPLVVVLFIAVFMRVSDYGITVNRYIIILLGIWLSIVALYSILRGRNIKFIPLSLTVMLLLMSFGPWSMFSVSKRSQLNRLEKLLVQNEILKDGKIQNETPWPSDNDFYNLSGYSNEALLTDSIHKEVRSIVDYLDDFHGLDEMQPWFTQNVDSLYNAMLLEEDHRYMDASRVYMNMLGLKYETRYYPTSSKWYNFNSIDSAIIDVRGVDYVLSFTHYTYNTKWKKEFALEGVDYTMTFSDSDVSEFVLTSENGTITFNLDEMVERVVKKHGAKSSDDLPANEMVEITITPFWEFQLNLSSLSVQSINDKLTVKNSEGDILITKRKTND